MTEAIKIRSHEELIAAIPHALGFKPVKSMVCVPFGRGPIARVDLPDVGDELEPWLKTLTDVYLHSHRPERIALVAFGDDSPQVVKTLNALSDALSTGPDVGPVLWVRDEEWTELLTGARGTLSPSAGARIDAEYAVRGRVMPVGSRAEFAAAMVGEPGPVAAHLAHSWERFRGLDEAALDAEVSWVGTAIAKFLKDRRYLSDLDAARALVAISDPGIRDASALAIGRVDAPVLAELWQDLTRRAPAEVRDGPTALLALSSWLDGHGAKAWTALDQLTEPNRLSALVETALRQALDPAAWDRAVPAATRAVMQNVALHESPSPDTGRRHDPGNNPDPPGSAARR
ncbi:hypothetical protein ACVW00_003333 [Marmoricola sp. URHA0025 HA25]